jgi:hypothetical protein
VADVVVMEHLAAAAAAAAEVPQLRYQDLVAEAATALLLLLLGNH